MYLRGVIGLIVLSGLLFLWGEGVRGQVSPRARELQKEAGDIRDRSRRGDDSTDVQIQGQNDVRVSPGALHKSCYSGNIGEVKVLLSHGAKVNSYDSNGNTPLHLAAYRGHLDVVKLLIANGALVDAQDPRYITPLHLAAGEGYPDIVRVLLEAGADPNARDRDGSTPLHKAAFAGKADVVKVLLQSPRIVPNLKDSRGRTPLDMAERYRRGEWQQVVELLRSPPKKGDDTAGSSP